MAVTVLTTVLSIVVGSVPTRAGAETQTLSKAKGTIVTSKGVRLTQTSETHNNRTCGDPLPGSVPQGASASFCYEDVYETGRYTFFPKGSTDVSFVYAIEIPGANDSWVPSGYSVSGHILITGAETGGPKPELQCSIDKTDPAAPPRQFSCLTSTVSDLSDPNPQPSWTVTAGTTIPARDPRVYFLGDSVTAGFGYCGTEGGPDSSDIACTVNQPFNNDWTGQNSLQACAPPQTINDRCSNNNRAGTPWAAGPWSNGPGAPTVAYSYAIGRKQSTVDPAVIENWAITGSTPADWDPVTNGRFGAQLKKIKNANVVMTLGANPLLSDYLNINVLGLVTIQKGSCASSTGNGISAAPLNSSPGGVLNCFDAEWQRIEQTKHLVDIYESLLKDGNHVLVLGYPMGCPWSFGTWQPAANLFSGPAAGNSCTSQVGFTQPPQQRSPFEPPTGPTVTQWDQAVALTTDANGRIKEALSQAGEKTQRTGDIAFATPSANWADHQAWSSDPWIFKNDTWVHPNASGHEELAQTVIAKMCERFHHWCGNPPRWNS